MSNPNPDDRELWKRYQRARRALPERELGGLDVREAAAYADDPSRLPAAERAALERRLLTDEDALEALEQVRRTAIAPPAIVADAALARARSRLARELDATAGYLGADGVVSVTQVGTRLRLLARAPLARRLAAAALLVATWGLGFASGRAGGPTVEGGPVAVLPAPPSDVLVAHTDPISAEGELVLLDPDILRELALDATQRSALATLDAEARVSARDLSGSIQAAQLAVACAAKDPSTPPQELRELSLALADLQQDSDYVRDELLERFTLSLGETQRMRMVEMLRMRPGGPNPASARFDVDRDGQLDRSEREKLYAEMRRRIEMRKKGMSHPPRPHGSGSDRPLPPWRGR